MQRAKKKTTWQITRIILNEIHLWMGIASGIVLFIVCLSGTIYTFSSEIQEMLEPEKYQVKIQPGAEPLPAEVLIQKVLTELGEGTVQFISIPEDPSRTYLLNINKAPNDKPEVDEQKNQGNAPRKEKTGPVKKVENQQKGLQGSSVKEESPKSTGEENVNRGTKALNKEAKQINKPSERSPSVGRGRNRGTTYLVDPYTAEIKGTTESPASVFFMTMFRLHRWLLLDMSIGRPIVGWATVIFVFIILTGIIIWIPQKVKAWKQGLKIKFDSNWKRINHDLHNTLGFYSFFLLLIMGLTGLTWSFEWYKEGFNKVLGVTRSERPAPLTSDVIENANMLPVADLLKICDEALPYKGNYRISVPENAKAVVSVSKNKTGFFAPAASDRIQLDQYTGKILKTDIFSEKALNDRIVSSIKPLHVGDVYGTFSKILYFISCLIATSLPVTGTIIWINKLKKKSRKKDKNPKSTELKKANKKKQKVFFTEV